MSNGAWVCCKPYSALHLRATRIRTLHAFVVKESHECGSASRQTEESWIQFTSGTSYRAVKPTAWDDLLCRCQSELKCDSGTKPRATCRSIRTSSSAFHCVPKQVWSNRSLGLERR